MLRVLLKTKLFGREIIDKIIKVLCLNGHFSVYLKKIEETSTQIKSDNRSHTTSRYDSYYGIKNINLEF